MVQNTGRINHLAQDKVTSGILSGLDDCVDNFCSKYDIHESMFGDWVKKVKEKIDNRTSILNFFHKHEQKDFLNYSDTKKALDSIHRRFVVVLID